MSTNVATIEAQEPAEEAWARMEQKRIRHLVVFENRQLVGVVSDRDLGGRKGRAIRRGHSVSDLMTRKVVTASPGMRLREAANVMRGRLIGSLPVMQNGRLLGIVTATDVLDELGRGATRQIVRTQRRTLRSPPKLQRRAARPRNQTQRRKVDRDSRTPAHIHVSGVELSEENRAYIRRKLGTKLDKFKSSIERVTVRVEDINGPRGGVDQVCRIKVVLTGLPSVLVEKSEPSLGAAIDVALASVERAVWRALQRRRTSPIQRQLRTKETLAA